MDKTIVKKEKLNPRKTFWKCGGCSHAIFHLINHELDNSKPEEEKASDLLAGGIAQKGHQCGMIWGGALAAGTEAYRKFEDKNRATSAAIIASKYITESFENRAKTVNCKDIVKIDWENKLQMAIYMLKIISRGFVYSPCFNYIVKWTPEAELAAKKGLESTEISEAPSLSCTSELINKMGGTNEEAMMVAGFAGGIGLSGNTCGAVAAAIWYKALLHVKNAKGKSPAMFSNPDAKKAFRALYIETDSETQCSKICGKKFNSVSEHTEYIQNGGCKSIIESLAKI